MSDRYLELTTQSIHFFSTYVTRENAIDSQLSWKEFVEWLHNDELTNENVELTFCFVVGIVFTLSANDIHDYSTLFKAVVDKFIRCKIYQRSSTELTDVLVLVSLAYLRRTDHITSEFVSSLLLGIPKETVIHKESNVIELVHEILRSNNENHD